MKTLCVECGPNVMIDEDGCCKMCGGSAVGTWFYKHADEIGAPLKSAVRLLLRATHGGSMTSTDVGLIETLRQLADVEAP